jgi:hypothetical protein
MQSEQCHSTYKPHRHNMGVFWPNNKRIVVRWGRILLHQVPFTGSCNDCALARLEPAFESYSAASRGHHPRPPRLAYLKTGAQFLCGTWHTMGGPGCARDGAARAL